MSAQPKEELVLREKLDENSSLPISPRGALECADLHINEKELWTLMKFLQTKSEKLKDTVLCWRCNNNAALAAIKK